MSSTHRNIDRSEKNRHFVGSVVMVLEEQRRWAQFFPEPLAWLLELESHPQFMRVMRNIYTEKYGSIYSDVATTQKIKDLLADLNIVTFRHLLFVASDPQAGERKPQPAHIQQQKVSSPSHQLEVEKTIRTVEEHIAGNVLLPTVEEVAFHMLPIGNNPLAGFGTVAEPEPASVASETQDDELCLQQQEHGAEEREKIEVIGSEGVANDISNFISLTLGRNYGISEEKREELNTIIVNNDVYIYGERVYGHMSLIRSPTEYSQFMVVIYAPPGSGKTYFNESVLQGKARDTASMINWNSYSHLVLTDMSHYIDRAQFSIALIPSRPTFYQRCIERGLQPRRAWYDDMRQTVNRAKFKIYSNRFLSEAFLECTGGRNLLRKCCVLVKSPPSRTLWNSWQLSA